MVVTMSKLKTLKIKEETHRRLAAFGRKGETFDAIINRLLDTVALAQAERLEHRLKKVSALGELAARRWRAAQDSGRIQQSKEGWRVRPGAC